MSALTAAQVTAAFHATDQTIDPSNARMIAAEVTTYGDVDTAAMALANDFAHDALNHMLAYRASLQEISTPGVRIDRLRREANDCRAKAKVDMELYGSAIGRAIKRRDQGEIDLAAVFFRQAHVNLASSVRLLDEASHLDAQADKLEASLTPARISAFQFGRP